MLNILEEDAEQDGGGQVDVNDISFTPSCTPSSFGIHVAPFSMSTALLPTPSKLNYAIEVSLFSISYATNADCKIGIA